MGFSLSFFFFFFITSALSLALLSVLINPKKENSFVFVREKFHFCFSFFDDNIELLPVSSSMIQKLILDIIAAY